MKMGSVLAATVLAAATVAHAAIVDNFEGQSAGTWSSQTYSEFATIDDPLGTSGNHVLRWIYHDSGTDWGNEVKLTFAASQDWSTAQNLTFRLEAGAVTASNRRIGVYLINNGVKMDFGQASVLYDSATGYETFNLSLTSGVAAGITFNHVTLLGFYVYGGYYSAGDSQFYIDDISVDTKAIPEPAALGIVACGLTAVVCRRKRGSSRRAAL